MLADPAPLPEEVVRFLDSGDPPVFVGFGSMPADSEAARGPVAAARAAGRRVIVSRGWADLAVTDESPDCLVIGDVGHDALFPRVAAVVHHGGAGTTAAAARAGVPQIVTPMFGDQFYWAGRVVDLGVGAAVAHGAMTERSLAEVLRKTLRADVEVAARTLARQVRRDGAEIAARRLEAEHRAAPHR